MQTSQGLVKQVRDFSDEHEVGVQEPDFKPLSREQAQQWRAGQPVFSVWRLLGVQLLVGLVAAALGWGLTQSAALAWSVLYGAAAVVLPSAVMAFGVTMSVTARLSPGFERIAMAAFLFWEGVKIALAVLMLWVAPQVVSDLSWLALLAGLVVVLKVNWFGFMIQRRRSIQNG
ncbi:MAG: ATP synthase subunit I [Hydrogenophaga sp.]|nr:ATP synthase subunit I [Hydrogenophaga sp.]